ncbi:HNH endonuclease [Enemella evansiae]|uniref:HNH endonuclease n=1 Tax=Enemella evansiae TaxID=2016499 RepID=UPI001595886D|nr:HNH endonuclease [Enemella evansiae]
MDELPEIDWSEASNAHIRTGDTVFLYATAPQQCLTHELVVVAEGIAAEDVIDDQTYWTDLGAFAVRTSRTWMRVRLVRKFTPLQRQRLGLAGLVAAGLPRAPQGRQRLTEDVLEFVRGIVSTTAPGGDAAAEIAAVDVDDVRAFAGQLERGEFAVADQWATTKTRASAQRAFAQRVKTNYRWQCAVTGISTPEFLVASHIVPWAEDPSIRLDPANGICLSTLVDRAFDAGYLRITPQCIVEVDLGALSTDAALAGALSGFQGVHLSEPEQGAPDPAYLARRYADL